MKRSIVARRTQVSLVDKARKITDQYFSERAGRADIAKAKRILKRAGKGIPPVAGDEL